MSGIPEEHRGVVLRLLDYFPDDEIFNLSTTVSRGKIVVSTVNEAKGAILCMSDSVESVLKRKKVKQEYLMRFLYDCQIDIGQGLEKTVLIIRFLQYLPTLAHICDQRPINSGPAPIPPESQRRPEQTAPPEQTTRLEVRGESGVFGAAFAEQFVPWYIETFNNGAPAFGPQHFWPDANVRIVVQQANSSAYSLEFHDANAAAKNLLEMHRGGLRLVATPHVSGACTSADVDEFGRVKVVFRGCIHHSEVSGPAGLFQQTMGLIQDVPSPSTSRTGSGILYKIKFLHFEVESQLQPELVCARRS